MTAPKKEKVVSAKGDEAEEMLKVLNYLVQQNRPYGATDLSANLKNRVSKAQAQKALASLHEKGEIMGKTYGKSTVYCGLQKDADNPSAEDMTATEAEIAELQGEETRLKEQLKQLAAQEAALLRAPETVELGQLVKETEGQCATLTATLQSLRTSSGNVSTAELTSLTTAHSSLVSLARSRVKVAKEMEGMLLEMFDKSGKSDADLEEVWERVGGEWGGEGERTVWREVREMEEKEKGGKKGRR